MRTRGVADLSRVRHQTNGQSSSLFAPPITPLAMTDRYIQENSNFNDAPSYVVGILSPSTTLYIDRDNRGGAVPPTDLSLRRRNTNSFQITSVTVQGSRKNEECADDSADDYEESHTDDLSSDFLDSSRADNDVYSPEDVTNPLCDDLSPCGPIIFAQATVVEPNMNLSLGVTPTYTSMGPVAGGVTMMTSKSESPVSAQVPMMNPLPENWQRRFRVVKIVSSEPFKRGRWTCMDFKDPPTVQGEVKQERTNQPPSIQITNYDVDSMMQDQCGLPIEQAFDGSFVMGNQPQMYGIILPQNDQIPPVALVQDMSIQTTIDRNSNHIVDQPPQQHQNTNVGYSSMQYQTVMNSYVPGRSYTSANDVNYNRQAPVTAVSQASVYNNNVASMRQRTYSGSIVADMNARNRIETENSESFSSLASELSRTSGLSSGTPAQAQSPAVPAQVATNAANGHYSPPPRLPANVAPKAQVVASVAAVAANSVVAPPPVTSTIVPDVIHRKSVDINSSHTAPEKVPSTELGHEVESSAGSAASAGANTVAIDNKIEQAMDLVKSHLMFAVREEVEVLKEKISELLERISQLEHENDILRANASAETLKQLNNQSHKKIMGGQNMKPQTAPPQPSST